MDRKWLTLIAVCIGTFMLLLDVTIVNVALPAIQVAFHAPLSDLQWVIDAYALSLASLLLTAGSLADRFGRRVAYGVGMTIFTLGSLACGLASGPLFLVIARAAQGVGGATMFATGLAIIAEAFQGRDRGVAFGAFGTITGLAVAVGPVLGGVITTTLSWRWIFFVNVPVGVGAIAITLTAVEESRNPEARRADVAGFMAFTVSLAALVFGLIHAESDGWSATLVIACLVGSGVLLVAFIVIEQRSPSPMFPLGLVRKPTFAGGLISAFCLSASLFSLLTYIVLYFEDVLRYSAEATGVRFLVLSGSIFCIAGLAGRATNKVPTRFIIAPGFVLVGMGILTMRGITATTTWSHLVVGMALSGVGAGLVTVPLASTAIGVVEPRQAGVASGINSTLRQVGIATGIAALGTILSAAARSTIVERLAATPIAAVSNQIARAATSNGASGDASLPAALAPYKGLIEQAASDGFIRGLNDVLLISACVAFAGAAGSIALIRQRDFVAPGTGGPGL